MAGETQTRQVPIVCPGHSRPLAEVYYSPVTPDGIFLMSGCHAKTPMLRRADTGDWVGTFEGHKGAVHGVCMDDHALLAATASADYTARMWDAVSGDQVHEFVHKHIVKSVEFARDRSMLATGGHEGVLRTYSVAAPEKPPLLELKVVEGPDKGSGKVVLTKVRWAKDPNLILVGSSDGGVRAWDTRTGTMAMEAIVEGGVVDLEVSRSQDVVSVAAGGAASFFDAGKLQLLKVHAMPIGKSTTGARQAYFKEEGGVSLHPAGDRFVAGGADLWVRVFNFETGEEMECHKGHHGPIRTLRYAPDGGTYATGSEDGTIRIWSTRPKDLVASRAG